MVSNMQGQRKVLWEMSLLPWRCISNSMKTFFVAASSHRRLWTPSTLTFNRSFRLLLTFYHSMPTPVTKEGVDFSLHSEFFSRNIIYSVKSTPMLGSRDLLREHKHSYKLNLFVASVTQRASSFVSVAAGPKIYQLQGSITRPPLFEDIMGQL
ncbi:hypothetical protein CY34DRAFT_215670 [Suillus luteus UH-Slu-Lm8-n1]|uniref:Uncharacterized protein n=1 Tax=Suillus luteus UH-Slu-Lm8-n1 TaxID=930992 RepID=A0A0D0AHK6_9AGAM|nr:hypothetical protein CY34DRAFT_215670 [Suillus luteus UH-Slu-Lm8-n1]